MDKVHKHYSFNTNTPSSESYKNEPLNPPTDLSRKQTGPGINLDGMFFRLRLSQP
jgi:hypothetical protein